MSGLSLISKKLIFCIKPTYVSSIDMNIPCMLFQQATVGVHYLVFMSICCAKKTKIWLHHCISQY